MVRQAGQREAQYGIDILTLQFIMAANLYATFISANIKFSFTFYVVSQQRDGTGSWNPSSINTISRLFCMLNIIAADDLAAQGFGTSAAMVLT